MFMCKKPIAPLDKGWYFPTTQHAGSCEVQEYDCNLEGALEKKEMEAYHTAMEMYCAFERGNFKKVDF